MLENVVRKIGLVTEHSQGKHSVGPFGAPRADLFILNLRLGFLKQTDFARGCPQPQFQLLNSTRILKMKVCRRKSSAVFCAKNFWRTYAQPLVTRALGEKRLDVISAKKFLRYKTAKEYVDHIFLFNTRVEPSSWSWQCGPPRANSIYFINRDYNISRICTWRPILATPAAHLHKCVEEGNALHIILCDFGL